MRPTNTVNKEHNTRNKPGIRGEGRGAQNAAPSPRTSASPPSRPLSPTRVKENPHRNQNKDGKSLKSPTILTTKVAKSKATKDNSSLQTFPKNGRSSNDTPLYDKQRTLSTSHAPLSEMGDNREIAIQTDTPPGEELPPSQVQLMVAMAAELKEIRGRLDKLDRIDASTSSLDTKLGGLLERTASLETSVASHSSKLQEAEESIVSHSSKIHEVNTELADLRATVELQGRAIAKLTTMKTDILKKNKEAVGEINSLIGQHKKQVDALHTTTQTMEEKILIKVEEKVEKKEKVMLDRVEKQVEEKVGEVSHDMSFKSMKDQAFQKRHNIVFSGLEEDHTKSTVSIVKNFCRTLGINKVNFESAYRLGNQPQGASNYCRPVIATFSRLADRNRTWRKRKDIPSENTRPIRIQADLPKALRDETAIMYRVIAAAKKFKKFNRAVVRNFAVQLNGKEFPPHKLELLPTPLRPSTISNPRSETAIAFFSKYSPLSNHHPSVFVINGQEYHTMEHLLAYERAKISENEDTIRRAQLATDPKEAKAILNSLREDHPSEWDAKVEDVTTKGLKAKFSQNDHLLAFLKSTGNLQIGEASTNERWGTGFSLTDPEVLDTEKWNPNGNLLGRCLMKVRDELCPTEDGEK